MELIKHNNINFELLYNDTNLHRYKGVPIFPRNITVALFGTEAMQPRQQTYRSPRMFNKMGPGFGQIPQFWPNLVNPYGPPLPNPVPPPHNMFRFGRRPI